MGVMAKKKKKPVKQPVDVGRPTKYRPEYDAMLIAHMATGLGFECFAGVVDVCDDTLREWEKEFPTFSAAKKQAFAKNRLFWEKTGIEGLYPTVEVYGANTVTLNLNSKVWALNMKNRFGWRESIDLVSKGDVKGRFMFTKDKKADNE